MSVHPLVHQLRFARKEFMRVVEGVGEEDACRRLLPMNCLSWIVGHLANQEARYWVARGQGDHSFSWLNEQVGYNKPASTPPLADMLEAWRAVTARADAYLDTLTPQVLATHMTSGGRTLDESIGTMLQRNLYHYWFHTGEAHAIRQMLGHANLPEYVGSTQGYAYQPEEA